MPNQTSFDDIPLETEPTENVMHMWTPLDLSIGDNYEYVKKSVFFKLWAWFLHLLVIIIFPVYNRVLFGLRVKGKQNIKELNGGAISVSNHIHVLDCTMVGCTMLPKSTYFPTLKSNLEIPFIRWLVRGLYGIPIPEKPNEFNGFRKAIKEIIAKGNIVQLYPEGILVPYYNDGVRSFRKGAFSFSYDCNVPILPIVYTYRKVEGRVARFFHRRPYITMNILKPLYPDLTLERREGIQSLKEEARRVMSQEYIEKNEFARE